MIEELPRPSRFSLDAVAIRLAKELGESSVLRDEDILAAYAEDYSFSGRFLPDLVVRASSTEDVAKVMRAANDLRVPVTPRGLGSGKAGGALPICGGIVLSLERMRRLKEISREDMVVVAEPGIVTQDLMTAVESEGLFYPPDPNSLKISSFGGNVACNSGGPRALKYGVTRNYVLALELVTPTGEILRVGHRPIKGVTGYDLAGLIVGSEGTLAVITEITARLIPMPSAIETALVCFADLESASIAVTKIFGAGIVPRTLEFLDQNALDAVRKKTPGRFPENAGALLILETDATSANAAQDELERAANVAMEHGALDVLVAQNDAQREKIWEPRRVLSMTLAETAPMKISEDVSVPRSKIPALLTGVREIGERLAIRMATYGHAGDGNIHVNLLFSEHELETAHRAAGEVMKRAVDLGGTISGEHGIGIAKRKFLRLEQSEPLIDLQRGLKAVFDPNGILNPGKIFPARGVRE
ncbi:MAG: FAD-binding protein [Deltaproteobacteria bacterium]|nr:FAD-binding protein [Deltaproteobacteria bacterium]